jgi:hypothetical protein
VHFFQLIYDQGENNKTQNLNRNCVSDEDIQSTSYRIVTIIIRDKFMHITTSTEMSS